MSECSFHELVQVAVENVVRRAAGNAGAQVFDHLIGLQHVGADLVAPADLGLGSGFGAGSVLALLQFGFIHAGTQHVPGLGTVLVLRALLLALHDDTGRDMRDAYGRVSGVDVLTTGARRTIGIDAAVAFVDLDLDRVVDNRIDPDRREGGVATRIAVVGRDPHQPVHARFRLQPAIGIVALDEQGRGLDARLFAVMDFEKLDLEALAFGPAGVHAQKHVRPVLTFGAAGAGMDFEIGVVAIGFAGEHGFHLAAPCLGLQGLQRVFGFLDDALVALFLAKFDQLDIVVQLLFELLDAVDAVIELLAFAHQFLRFGSVVPEVRILCLVVQPVQPSYRLVPVKDASSAG